MGKDTVEAYDNWDLWDKLTFYKKKIRQFVYVYKTYTLNLFR